MGNIYTENGFKGRLDYLRSVSEDFGVDMDMVKAAASVLGPNEDFDGLITTIEDYANEVERGPAF